MNEFIKATIIALWRQGNPDAVICLVTDCSLTQVFDTINDYKTNHQ